MDYEARQFVTQGGKAVKKGDIITLDGTTGEVCWCELVGIGVVG